MGKHFGNLIRLYGVTIYTLSPNELNPFKGILVPGFMNTVRRFRENVFYIGIPMVLAIVTMVESKKINEKMNRKDPLEYECEDPSV